MIEGAERVPGDPSPDQTRDMKWLAKRKRNTKTSIASSNSVVKYERLRKVSKGEKPAAFPPNTHPKKEKQQDLARNHPRYKACKTTIVPVVELRCIYVNRSSIFIRVKGEKNESSKGMCRQAGGISRY